MAFAKALKYRVNNSLLTHKLDHYGISGSSNKRIANFLTNGKHAVVVEGAKSDYISVKSSATRISARPLPVSHIL